MYFWQSKLIPQELREHIAKTLKRTLNEKMPTGPGYQVHDFLKECQVIMSGSQSEK